jgi:hypothetical protein
VVKRRPALSIGWGSGLLAAWVMAETVIFWRIIWRARDALPDTSAALFAGFGITGLYFFAGAMVFPDAMDGRSSLQDHFMQVKAKVISAVLLAVALSLTLRYLVLGDASWRVLTVFDWASLTMIYVLGPIAMVTKRLRVAIACLAVLVGLDLIEPVGSLMWTR